MWSTRQRKRDSERPRLSAGIAPQRSPSSRYTVTVRDLESGSSRVPEIQGAGDQPGDSTLRPCAGAGRQGYVTNARALERAAPVAARGRRFPARRCARPRPGASPCRPPRPGRAGLRFPTLPEPAGQAAEGRGVAASVRSVTASPGRHGPARAPARGSRFSLSLSPAPQAPAAPSPNPGFELVPPPAPRPPRWRLDLLGWHRSGRALRSTPGALPEPPTQSLSAEGRIAARAGSRAQIALRGSDFSRGSGLGR